ncbi:ABC transporter substrate-binding protein [Paenibacillus hamazuiensis]|uniref:ABC transporter substrate-binding protein n=1 Tax=Paenibacillus hamazuiensis TaxID=2936508 RepID=UPI0020108B1A|nr:Fe(3+) dicitrate ABC transporter substrate-binding protein [Paenibacillus hamazuiensis]
MRFAAMILVSLFLVISGCSSKPAVTPAVQENTSGKDSERKVKHELGETSVKGTPQRVVALEFSFVDALATVGVTPVGVADDGDANNIIEPIRQKIGKYTSIGSRYEVNFELIASLKPDLIIADLSRHKEVYDKLGQIAPTIVLKSLGSDYKENMDAFAVIAEALNAKDAAQKKLADHQTAMNALKQKMPKDEKRTVLPAVANSTGFFAHTSRAYAGSLLEQLGYKDAIQSNEAYPKITLEQLVQANPDVMFLMTGGEKTIVDEWKNNPLWSQISAVKNNQVFEVDRRVWSLSRGVISAETIAGEALQLLYGKK